MPAVGRRVVEHVVVRREIDQRLQHGVERRPRRVDVRAVDVDLVVLGRDRTIEATRADVGTEALQHARRDADRRLHDLRRAAERLDQLIRVVGQLDLAAQRLDVVDALLEADHDLAEVERRAREEVRDDLIAIIGGGDQIGRRRRAELVRDHERDRDGDQHGDQRDATLLISLSQLHVGEKFSASCMRMRASVDSLTFLSSGPLTVTVIAHAIRQHPALAVRLRGVPVVDPLEGLPVEELDLDLLDVGDEHVVLARLELGRLVRLAALLAANPVGLVAGCPCRRTADTRSPFARILWRRPTARGGTASRTARSGSAPRA